MNSTLRGLSPFDTECETYMIQAIENPAGVTQKIKPAEASAGSKRRLDYGGETGGNAHPLSSLRPDG